MAVFFLFFQRTAAHDHLEALTYDARVRWTATTGDPNIVIVDVDDASFDMMKKKGWRWPWTRRAWAETIRFIQPGGPRVIVFDASFGGSEDEGADQSFAGAIQKAGNVVLAYSFSRQEIESNVSIEERWKVLQAESSFTPHHIGQRVDPYRFVLDAPLPILAQSAAGLGNITGEFDPDGTVRRLALNVVAGDRAYRSLGLRAADLAVGNPNQDGRLQPGQFLFREDHPAIPVDDHGNLIAVWHRNISSEKDCAEGLCSYDRISIFRLICSISGVNCPAEVGRISPDIFKDKIVIIGASAAGSYDAHPIPFRGVAPGFLAHATLIDNLLHGEAVRPTPGWIRILLIGSFASFGSFLLIRISEPMRATIFAVIGLLLYTGFAVLGFRAWHWWVPLVGPLGAFASSFVATGAVRFATTGRELRRTRGTLDRYVAPQLVDYVLSQIDHINFAGEKRELTIFFSDVRNFTTLTEGTPPTELIALLNEYLAAMTEIVFKYEGIVDKFIGDGILAYWGAFTPGKNHALLASQASLEMLDRLKQLNEKWASEGRKQLAIGIGLNSGEVIFGNVGAGKKVEFTVIGDAVNLAARLESLNKEYRTSIIISEFTLAMLGTAAVVEPLGGVRVKGKTVETQIYELQALAGKAASAAIPRV